MIEVLTMPDWRAGNNYQSCLAEGLRGEGFKVVYPTGYRRLLPLSRAGHPQAPLLHLHWPEAYFRRGDPLDRLRRTRFAMDLILATRRRRLIYTAHNFFPHDASEDRLTRRNYRAILTRASAVIAHSDAAARKLAEFCPLAEQAIHVVPHGDPADAFPSLPPAAEARRQLGLNRNGTVVLMFGRVEPYKGLEEVIRAWPSMPASMTLLVAGEARTFEYGKSLQALAANHPRIKLKLQRLSDQELAVHLAAADAVLFNYRRIFTSGTACLARSLGKRIVIPAHLDTVDLMEPAATISRFSSVEADLPATLAAAMKTPENPAETERWRQATSWRNVAQTTAAIYRRVLGA